MEILSKHLTGDWQLETGNWRLGTGNWQLVTSKLGTSDWKLVTNNLLNTQMSEAGYKKLIVWQKADKLAKDVYIKTKGFPEEERYGITSQLRRAAISVPLNIVEGCARQSKKELKNFANIALGSLAETEYLLDFSRSLNYLTESDHDALQSLRQEVGNLLWKFFQSI